MPNLAVFSTSVEVFPGLTIPGNRFFCLLHVRGGVSKIELVKLAKRASSPRPWRCFLSRQKIKVDLFVFSTSVEVFLTMCRKLGFGIESSPRPWRCFQYGRIRRPCLPVFSTSVEVFLRVLLVIEPRASLLHVRGGVSKASSRRRVSTMSSPRPWRCFFFFCKFFRLKFVFSTSVEVFPTGSNERSRKKRLLHVRGGVSGNSVIAFPVALSSPRPWRCFQEWRLARYLQ